MAKGANPADAFRKAQRKKELKKNKAERSKARDFALVKKDTRDIEDEIEKLEASAESSASDRSRLADLKAELSKVMAKKEEYIKEHPDQRKLVYRARRQEKVDDQKEAPPIEQKRNLFDKHGLPRHPERSIYYDPVMNPYGVPPPGMPYMERPLKADEVPSDEGVEGSDEDIVMPQGPPPGASMEDADSDNDDDIPMPEGPPPSATQHENPPLPQTVPSLSSVPVPPLLLGTAPQTHLPIGIPPFIPPPPPGFGGNVLPPGPFGAFPPFPPPSLLQPMPPPPPGFFPRRAQSAASIQDPLSSVPHQTYQAHRVSQLQPGHPSLPAKPLTGSSGPSSVTSARTAAATISAEPQLRDFKKEATAFVPASLKRKKASALPVASKVNAAPSINAGSDSPDPSPQSRPDLVSTLRDQFGGAPPLPPNGKAPAKGPKTPSVRGKDDYQKFVDEMGELLGTSNS
ncbi:hypothetical protein HYDPIDRAFT_175126 [Hydnomerulius pinastri MD-312]|uniref:Wbp11/ELF5/Saf1 N-terminal domain-containing protein n=1 Tax=Hydnomerulius pinastri MD-312 TaxID=994086 RepID=A0A0C9W271_9AGAM|nr:hypothetical protein HYDPIDRAFT_175126 [Hydnomerulius pinastri MD-312]